MFSSLKSFSSNINSNYSVSSTLSSTAGAWKIYDAKKKSTGKTYSVFVFDKKALDSHGKSQEPGARKDNGNCELKPMTDTIPQATHSVGQAHPLSSALPKR